MISILLEQFFLHGVWLTVFVGINSTLNILCNTNIKDYYPYCMKDYIILI